MDGRSAPTTSPSPPHKSVSLAIEFAKSPAEAALLWHAIDRATDATMRYAARELGWARKGAGGKDGADPGAVAWVTFRHHVARPTLHVEDGPTGVTYLADIPMPGDPHAHTHNVLFNAVATKGGRIGSLDTKELQGRVHEFGAFFQAFLADEMRRLGVRVAYDDKEEAFVLVAIPREAVDAFSKGRRQTVRYAKKFAERQGLDWDSLPAERKFGILHSSAIIARQSKHDGRTDRAIWLDQAEALAWRHTTVFENAKAPEVTNAERFDRAYAFAARHLARDFETAAVLDHTKLRTLAARGLIDTGIAGGVADIDAVVGLLEQRGITIKGEHASLLIGVVDERVRVTNTVQVRIEQALASQARRAALDHGGSLSEAALTAAIAASGINFEGKEREHGAAQKAMIYALGTGGALSVLTGPAGAGKSTLLRPLVAAYEADTRFSPRGREVIGIATGWKQTDALESAEIRQRIAVDPFLRAVDAGEIKLSRNTVLIIDEISQVATRPFLRLLELQAEHGFTIKGLGDREQCQAIEAGDTIEILRRVLPKSALPELITTVRQETRRGREIAGLFRGTDLGPEATRAQREADRLAQVKRALAMKREDGTARLIGGDQDQVIERIVGLYLERRDILRAGGRKRGVTISALTNADAADISRVVRERLKARGEIAGEERVYDAIDQNGETYTLPLAPGDRVRLYRKTFAWIDGKGGFIGSNGDVVEIVRWTDGGIVLRNQHEREGEVEWRRLRHDRTGRLLLGFGHAVTVDSSQGSTTGEHINALPRGTAGANGFKTYTAESRHVYQAYTMIAEAAVLEAVKHKRALGDIRPVSTEDLWDQVAADMSRRDYKPLGMDLLDKTRRWHERIIREVMEFDHRAHLAREAGRPFDSAIRAQFRRATIAEALEPHVAALSDALARNGEAVAQLRQRVDAFVRSMRAQTAGLARRIVAAAQGREAPAVRSASSPSPY